MRRKKLRFVLGGLALAVIAGMLSVTSKPAAGQVAKPAPPLLQPGFGQPGKKGKKEDKSKMERPPEEENIPFTFPYDRDARKQLEAARDYLEFGMVPYNTVCPLLQNILEAKSDSFFNTTQVVGGEKRIHRISVKTEANHIISEFKKEGLEFYQQAYGQTASSLLDDAIKANYDLPMLADLSQKFFHTKAGAEATVLLGTLYLERGNYLEAAFAFERVLGRSGLEGLVTPRTLFKACIAFKRSGDPKHSALVSRTLESLRKATERDGLVIGRKSYSFEQLKAEIERQVELIRPTSTVGEWAMQRGNPSRSGTVDGGPPFLDPIFRTPMLYVAKPEDEQGNNWIRDELERLFSRDNRMRHLGTPLPGFTPITTADQVVFRSYVGLIAVATRDHVASGKVVRAGDIRWVSPSRVGAHQLVSVNDDDVDMSKEVTKQWWNAYMQSMASSVLYENPLLGAISHDGTNAYFIDDVAIPPPPTFVNPDFGINAPPQQRQSRELADSEKAGRLIAVNLRSGSEVWELGRVPRVTDQSDPKQRTQLPAVLTEEEADVTNDAFHLCLDAIFLSAPLPLNGKLYVLIEQGGVLRLLCLDPKNLVGVPGQTRKPALVWSQKLGRANNPLPQDSVRRFQGCTLAASDGIIVCPTNSGALVAVDIMSRSLVWAHAYREVKPGDTHRQFDIDPRTNQPIPQRQLDPGRWHMGGPIIANGRVIVTAYDSKKLECLDLRTGKVLWWDDKDTNDLYVGGVVNDRVVVVRQNEVRLYTLVGDTQKQEKRSAIKTISLRNATPTGHGVGGKGMFYLPVRQENAGKNGVPAAEICVIDVEKAEVISTAIARDRNDNTALSKYGIGN
ncbi:MAG TPA: PQQ-binding-like beta-propeller repeat protein, partial [Gemmata sp.]|nr:PQQ-binding-like beta-propeller repeat protein [Gemmata sp.]